MKWMHGRAKRQCDRTTAQDRGADVNMQSTEGTTALHWAAFAGQVRKKALSLCLKRPSERTVHPRTRPRTRIASL